MKHRRITGLAALAASILAMSMANSSSWAFGEAGPIHLEAMGHFYVGIDVDQPKDDAPVTVSGQSYVGFARPVSQLYPEPLILIHGGGGQATDWFSTVDGRDSWRSYFLAAGIETYWIDRPGIWPVAGSAELW